MKNYNDIYNVVKNGAIVTITNHYGNKYTFFRNEKGKVRQRFNNCKDTYFNGSDVEIKPIDLRNMTITL